MRGLLSVHINPQGAADDGERRHDRTNTRVAVYNGHIFYSDDAVSRRNKNSIVVIHSAKIEGEDCRPLSVADWITCVCNGTNFRSMSVGRPED